MVALAFAIIAAALAVWVILPLFREEEFRAGESILSGELKDLHALKNVAYDTLRDLEFDFRMGKMAEKDYHELRSRYQREAAEIIAQIEALEERIQGDRKRPHPPRSPKKARR